MKTRLFCAALLSGVALLSGASFAGAQGCLAAHTNSSMLGCITSDGHSAGGGSVGYLRYHPLTVEVDWRSFSSFRHFSGTVENTSRQTNGNFIPNHQNLYNVSVSMQLSPRWSVNTFVPVLQGTRDQKYPPVQKVDIGGIGDMIVGVEAWVFRPPTERGGDIAFSAGLKLPTGINNGMGTGTARGAFRWGARRIRRHRSRR